MTCGVERELIVDFPQCLSSRGLVSIRFANTCWKLHPVAER